MKIYSAQLEKYNANSRGKSVSDCVNRAISLAFDIPYSEVNKLLNQKMKEKRESSWKISSVYGKVIEDLGGRELDVASEMPSGLTVAEFVDDYAMPGFTYILRVSDSNNRRRHLTCIRQGKVWDTWDCLDLFIRDCYEITKPNKEITDIKDKIKEIANSIYKDLYAELDKYFTRKNLNDPEIIYEARVRDYTIKTYWKVMFDPTDIISKARTYKFEVVFPLSPTMTEEEAKSFIIKTGKVRMYDRAAAVAKQEAELKEKFEMRNRLGDKAKNDILVLDSDASERFYNSLPGWARALIIRVCINNPGQWGDSYSVRMRKHPDDPHEDHPDKFTLEDFDANGIRQQLDIYKKDFTLPRFDYTKDW